MGQRETALNCRTVDDINPALPIIRNIPESPLLRVPKVMQDLYRQQYLRMIGTMARLTAGGPATSLDTEGLGGLRYRV